MCVCVRVRVRVRVRACVRACVCACVVLVLVLVACAAHNLPLTVHHRDTAALQHGGMRPCLEQVSEDRLVLFNQSRYVPYDAGWSLFDTGLDSTAFAYGAPPRPHYKAFPTLFEAKKHCIVFELRAGVCWCAFDCV